MMTCHVHVIFMLMSGSYDVHVMFMSSHVIPRPVAGGSH